MRLNVDNGRTKLDLELVAGEENAAQQLIEQLAMGGFFNHGQRTQPPVPMYGHENTGYFLPPVHDVHASVHHVHPYVQPPVPITIHDVQPVQTAAHPVQTHVQPIALPESEPSESPMSLRLRRIKWGAIAVLVGVSIGSSVLAWKRLTTPEVAKTLPPAPTVKQSPRPQNLLPVPTPPPLGNIPR